MKSLLTLIATLFFGFQVGNSAVLTVSNHPAGGAQYPSLRSAVDAASPGDTLLVEGTDIPYHLDHQCNVHWSKSLTVIGIGFNPNKDMPKRTKFQNTHCGSGDHFYIAGSAGGSKFYGIEFLNQIHVLQTANSLHFENCKFNNTVKFNAAGQSLGFANCVFDLNDGNNLYFSSPGSVISALITNCIFDGYIEGSGGTYNAISVQHCVFLSNTTSFSDLGYAQIRDNIFVNAFPGGTFLSDYDNNLALPVGSFPPAPESGNTGSDNIETSDPLFVSYTSGSRYTTQHDFDLQAGSPAIGSASDATDIGVHGGSLSFSETGEVLIVPIVREMSILNSSVAPNGTLNVAVRATVPSTD